MKHILNYLSINLVKSMKIDPPTVIIMIQKYLCTCRSHYVPTHIINKISLR